MPEFRSRRAAFQQVAAVKHQGLGAAERSLTFVARDASPGEDCRVSLEIGTDEDPQHFHDEMGDHVGSRLNWLRAGVLGANDGIVSTAGVVMGVAGATDDSGAILIAGIAALTAGALSMGTGEYVSVSTQRDSEKSLLSLEALELKQMPETEERELAKMYVDKGLSPETAERVARELTEHDALRAHADIEFGIDPDNLTNPWHAAWASMIAFTVGALLPLMIVAFVPDGVRIMVTVVSVMIALALTGFVSARIGYSPRLPAGVRNVSGGLLAMGVTYLIGMLAGTQLG
jgi:VIT1/CCC1 family predicted Fe2+/Mn2+ transporter